VACVVAAATSLSVPAHAVPPVGCETPDAVLDTVLGTPAVCQNVHDADYWIKFYFHFSAVCDHVYGTGMGTAPVQ
jgi:hypothetical protein